MSLILSGSDGLSDVDGTAATPAIRGTDTNTGIFFPAADTIAFSEGGAEAMRIDSAGNLGIGTTSPSQKLTVAGVAHSSNGGFAVGDGTSFTPSGLNAIPNYGLNFTTSGSLTSFAGFGGVNFYTAQLERMRVEQNGNLLVGTTSVLFASSHGFVNSGVAVLGLRNSTSTAGKYWQVGPDVNNSFKVYNQNSVGMFLSDGGTAWASSSDETIKDIIEPITNATEKVSSLRTVIGKYKTDNKEVRRVFLIAQDVQKVLPEAISETPEGYLGVAYTDIIPLLVASIKELKAELDSVKAELATLKA